MSSAASKGSQTKDDFGTLLFPLVLLLKITGKLLDLHVEDLRHLLVDGDALRAKVHEAMQVLQQAEQTQQDQEQKDQGPTPIEDEGAGREGGKRPRSGDASPEPSRRRWGEDPPTPDTPVLGPGGADLTTDTGTALCLMDADPPGTASSACPISPTAQTQLPLAPEALLATQPSEVPAAETPTKFNASCLLHSMTNCLNGAYSQGDEDEVQRSAAEFTRRSLQMPPSSNTLLAAGNRDLASALKLHRRREVQDILVHFGAQDEMVTADVKTNMGRVITMMVRLQSPSLIVASEVYHALLVEAARPESLPKFTIEYFYMPERTTPEPRPLPDPTEQ